MHGRAQVRQRASASAADGEAGCQRRRLLVGGAFVPPGPCPSRRVAPERRIGKRRQRVDAMTGAHDAAVSDRGAQRRPGGGVHELGGGRNSSQGRESGQQVGASGWSGHRPIVVARGKRPQKLSTAMTRWPLGHARESLATVNLVQQSEVTAAASRFVRRRVRVGESFLAYREARTPPRPSGRGPLVLVHGLGLSSRSFRPVMPYLVDRHVLAPDLPGCGGSPRPQAALTVEELVTVLCGWLDALGIERADFVGHSLGGQIIARLATAHPRRVQRLVIIASPPDPSAPTVWHKGTRLAKDALREPWPVVRDTIGDFLRAPPILAARTLRQALQADAVGTARAITAPTLVVQGARDPVVTLDWSTQLARLIPGAQLTVVADGTHALPGQSPRELARILLEFLADS